MPSPPITLVSIRGVLKAIAVQRMQHLVLDGFDGRREVGNQVVGIGIKADHNHVSQKLGDSVFTAVGVEDRLVNPGH